MIKIRQLQFTYQGADQPALANINLCVKSKSIFGLLGPNGAGKTTLLSMLSGLLPRPARSIFIDDCDLSSGNNPCNSGLSLVPQDYAFYQNLTVKENLNFFAGVQGMAKPVLKTRLGEVSEITGLQQRLNQKATTLSGGLKRRLNLAIGLLNSPKLLLLDEPTVGIDPHSRHFILEAIREINRQGTTIIYTSHYMEEVEALCDEIAVLDKGQVVVEGSLQALLQAQGKRSLCVDLIDLPEAQQLEALGKMPGLTHNSLRLDIPVSSEVEILKALETLQEQELGIGRIHYGAHNLEELFLDITQRTLRD